MDDIKREDTDQLNDDTDSSTDRKFADVEDEIDKQIKSNNTDNQIESDCVMELDRILREIFTTVDESISKTQEDSKNIETIRKDFKKLIERLTKTTQNFEIQVFIDELEKYLNTSKRLLYSEFTSIIIELNNTSDQSVGIIISNLENCIAYSMNEENEVSEDIQKTLLKLWDHANLASNQYNYFTMTDDMFIQKVSPIIEPKIDDLKTQYSSLNDEVFNAENEIKSTVEEVKNTKYKIVSDIIGLISIFVAISFVMFGGMTMLNNLFDFSNMQYIPITEMLCLGSLIGLILIAIIYAFMVFILKLLDKPYDDKPNLNWFLKGLVILLAVICAITFLIWFDKPNVNIYEDKNTNTQNTTQIEQEENATDTQQDTSKKPVSK